MLCTYCLNISLEKLRLGYVHAPSFKALQESSRSCGACEKLWTAVIKSNGCEPLHQDPTTIHSEPVILHANCERFSSKLIGISISSHGEDECFRVPGRVFGKVAIFEAEGTLASNEVAGRNSNMGTGSDLSFEVITSWIRECSDLHKHCPSLPLGLPTQSLGGRLDTAAVNLDENLPYLPPRVIDVGPSDGSREPYVLDLFDRKGTIVGNYITLSYCWGSRKPLTTTRKNLPERTLGIPISSLPATFKDAVILTRRLCIRYLWIDALCVLQDSHEDWRLHCSLMHAIYFGSFLTINAAASVDSHGGLFRARTQPFQNDTALILTDYPNEIHVTEYIEDAPFGEKEVSFTDARAWCYQELLLSPRVVTFGNSMLGWLCNEKRESVQDGDLGSGIGKGLRVLSNAFDWPELHHIAWKVIVNNYTKRDLTHELDKVPALMGIVSLLQYYQKDRYLAGIWQSDILSGLLWCVEDIATARRSQIYRAPTWSWLSIDGAIDLKAGTFVKRHTMAKVIGCDVRTKNNDDISEILGGMTLIQAPVVRLCFPDGKYYPVKSPSRINEIMGGIDMSPLEISCHFDTMTELQQILRLSSSVYCVGVFSDTNVFLAKKTLGIHTLGYGLLLSPTECHMTFRRVGMARTDSNIFNRCKEVELTII